MEPLAVETIIKQALEKPDKDRALIAETLIASLEKMPAPEVEKAWQEEIAHRIQEVDSGQVKCIPWEEVRDGLYGNAHAKG